MNWLTELDRKLFILINSKGAIPPLDGFFKILRIAETWIPLYLLLLFWMLRYAKKYAWLFILLSVICFACTDFISASIIKPFAGRIRPCYEPALQQVIRSLVDCAGKFSMPSSHASNHFGLATFWFLSVKWMKDKRWWWLWIWAFLVCYAQIYVGKHYPFDILVGACLGLIIGSLAFAAFKWSVNKYYGGKPQAV